MAENLRTTRYRNGDDIPNVTDRIQWRNLTTGAWAHYDNDARNDATYGKLYNWYSVDDERGLCPEGWRVPTDGEWKQLEVYLGMSQEEPDDTGYGGTNEGDKMKSTRTEPDPHPRWSGANVEATNESGFSAILGGYRNAHGNFNNIGYYGYWWSATEVGTYRAWLRTLLYGYGDVYGYFSSLRVGRSVRCIKD